MKDFLGKNAKEKHKLRADEDLSENIAVFKGEELLDNLRSAVGCMYLSDLHMDSFWPVLHKTLQNIVPQNYSLREWNDAVHYITGKDAIFDKETDAAEFLIRYMNIGE